MGMQLSQSLKLSQQLRMTVQLQQAIKLLQLNHMELVAAVNQELNENPTLEEIPGTDSGAPNGDDSQAAADTRAERADAIDQNNGATGDGEVDWEKVIAEMDKGPRDYANAAGPSRHDDLPPIEDSLSASTSLTEHLLGQLATAHCTDEERVAAACMVLNLDSRGYLELTFDEVSEMAGVEMDWVEGAHLMLLAFDPVGCGARDLGECLAVQAALAWPEDPFIDTIIREHLHDLETRNYAGLGKKIDMHPEDVVEYHRMIQELEPWPGRPFTDDANNYITPDIEVVKQGGEWAIVQNQDGLPRLRVSSHYKDILLGEKSSKEDKDYIKERLDSADFLIRSIYKRQRTIDKVMQCILRRQRGFFDEGPERLGPMVLRDVADEIGVHESTVSRVTTNKYVLCPHGIFELKYFFSAGISRGSGDDLAAEAVKEKLRKLVGDEDPKKPYSDSALTKLLAKDDIKIARRTVAKYREALGILPSNQRKCMF
jgi:RNA polymerase sigma-54 factor